MKRDLRDSFASAHSTTQAGGGFIAESDRQDTAWKMKGIIHRNSISELKEMAPNDEMIAVEITHDVRSGSDYLYFAMKSAATDQKVLIDAKNHYNLQRLVAMFISAVSLLFIVLIIHTLGWLKLS